MIDYQRSVPETVQSGCELRRSADRLSQIIKYHPGLQPVQNRPHIDPPILQPTLDSPRFNLHAEGSLRLLPSNSNLSFLGAPPISKRYLRAQIRPIPFNLYSPAAPRLIPRIFQPTFQAPRFPNPQVLTSLHYPQVNPSVITYQPTESITSIVTSFPGQSLRDDMAQQGGAQPEGNPHPPVLNIGAARCQPRTFSNDPTRGESWLVFRVHFNHVAKLNDWTPRQARYYLASCMVGEAAQAVLHIPTEVNNAVADTLEALLDKYQEVFLPPAQSETARLQFDYIEQGPNESILHYASKIRCLYLHAYADRDCEHSVILIRKFMRGLRNRFVRFEVMKSAPQSFSSAIAIAMNNTSLREAQTIMDGASGGATAGVYQIESSDNGVPVPVGVNNLQEEVRPRMGNSASGFNMAQIQCYQCGRFGHLARNCMQRRPQPRGRGRGARRPSFRTRPMGRPMGNQHRANIGRTSPIEVDQEVQSMRSITHNKEGSTKELEKCRTA